MKKLFKKIYLIIKKNPFVASIVGSIIGNLITLLINFLIKTLPSKNMNPSASNDILTWILLGFNILYFSIIFIIQIKVIIRNKKNKVQAELSQISEQSTVFFHKRIQDAFPGLNGLQWIRNPKKAIKRLDIFFKNPIIFRPGGHYRCDPIWWFRGDENSPIDTFKKITSKKIMINFNELVII